MSSPLQRKQWEAQEAAQREENIAVYKKWVASHPEIKDCMATLKAVEQFCDFGGMPLSTTDLDFALSNGMSIAKQYVPSTEETRADLINEIIDLLATGGKYSSFDLQNERKRMSANQWTVEKLTQRRDEIVEKQRLARLSTDEIRQQLQAQRPQSQDTVLPAEYTAERIRGMRAAEVKFLVKQFSVDAVNDRLANRS